MFFRAEDTISVAIFDHPAAALHAYTVISK
jgi:hypothetical protein